MGTTVIDISITRQTAAVTRAGFGTPILLGPHNQAELVLEYTDASDMLSDGFTASDALYKEAVFLKSQSPAPTTFKIGKLDAVAMSMILTPTLDNAGDADVGSVVSVTVNGVAAEYTIIASDTTADIAAGLTAAVDAVSGVSATDGDPDVLVVSDVAADRFELSALSNVTAVEDTITSGIASSIQAIRDLDDDWYGVGTSLRSQDDIKAIAAVVETVNRIFSATTHDAAAWDSGSTTDVLAECQALGYNRTTIWVQPQFGYGDGTAILGRMLTTTPGSSTWAHQQLSAVPVSNFTASQLTTIESKNGNYFRTLGGLGLTWDGSACSGEYVDVMRLVDWTEARASEGVLQVLAANEKVPYTNAGVEMIKTPIKAVLETGIINGGFAADPAPTVTAPRVADVSVNDKANRLLPDVKFSATLAGAIHQVVIKGTVSL